MKTAHIKLIALLTGLLLGILAPEGWPGWAQQPPRPRDPLRALRVALQEAGAPGLTGQQEDALRSLLVTFRFSRRPLQETRAAVQAAHRAYDDAIVAGDSATAKAQATTIANESAVLIGTNLQDEADFMVGVINVLKQNDDQLNLLVKRLGTNGVVRVLRALLVDNGLARGPIPGEAIAPAPNPPSR